MTLRFAFVAFAGLLLWSGALASPAVAAEPSCRAVAPNFAPSPHTRTRASAARFVGGAKLRSLIAAPCPQRPSPLDV